MAKRILIALAVVTLTLSLGVAAVKLVRHHRWQILLSFQNRDLRNVPRESARTLRQTIDVLLGDRKPNGLFFPVIFRTITNINSHTRYVLVLERPLLQVPDESQLRMYVFDDAGRLLTNDEYSGGWRADVTAVSVSRNDLLNQEALIVDTQYIKEGPLSHNYFVLDGDRIVPAYFDHEGKLAREKYLQKNPSIAPSIP
jgi:hypothetical protein